MDNNIKKLTCLIAFVFILLSLVIIIFKNTANGYEISIYDSYPIYFWLFLLISIFCGLLIMVVDSLNDTESKWWKVGFFIVIFSNTIILLLPFFRGYLTFGTGDVLSHIGYTLDIMNTGHFAAPGAYGENFYPIIHILMSSISQFTGLNLELIAETLPILFILFYMVSMYLLSKEITKDNSKSILIAAFASVLLFKTEDLMLAPSIQAFFLFPFVTLLFYKSYSKEKNSGKYSVLFVLMLLLIPFFHPGEGSLYLIPLFLGIYLSLIIYNKFNTNEKKRIQVNRNLINAVLIIFVTWATWFLSFSSFGRKVGKIIDWVIFQSGTTNVGTVSSLLVKANLSTIQFINLVIHSYGQQLIYMVLGLLISCIILIKMFYKKNADDLEKFTFSILFLIFIGLIVISFFSYTGVDSFRGIKYVLFVSTILIGIFSYDFVKNINVNYKKYGVLLIISIIMLSSVIGIFNAYASPTTKEINPQVTKMELIGDKWLLDNRNISIHISTIAYRQIVRFSDAILGQNGIKYNGKMGLENSPDHFNYTNVSSYGDSLAKDKYYVDWKANRIFYPEVYPEYSNLWRFTPNDFDYLDNKDNTVDSIYSNGEFWIYYIKSHNN